MTDEIRALVYALVVHFLSGGRGDEHQMAEWIHKAHRYSQRSQRRHPSLEFVAALERMLRAPDAFLTAFEPLLDSEDPWVRALARLHVGKARIVLGQGGRDADAYLETALAEFRALGERFGIWLALTELADRIAVRGELAARVRALRAGGRGPHGNRRYRGCDPDAVTAGSAVLAARRRGRSAAAMAEAQRYAERVTWPDALAELALSQAELARWAGDAEEARQQLGVAAAMLGDAGGAGEHPRGNARPARLPRRRPR